MCVCVCVCVCVRVGVLIYPVICLTGCLTLFDAVRLSVRASHQSIHPYLFSILYLLPIVMYAMLPFVDTHTEHTHQSSPCNLLLRMSYHLMFLGGWGWGWG